VALTIDGLEVRFGIDTRQTAVHEPPARFGDDVIDFSCQADCACLLALWALANAASLLQHLQPDLVPMGTIATLMT
jgi:hypothetical protein